MILQLKTGRLEADYFRQKFGVDILQEFEAGFRHLEAQGDLHVTPEGVTLTEQGLLHVDRLLPTFFLPEHVNARYT